jgi:hypothetical protein
MLRVYIMHPSSIDYFISSLVSCTLGNVPDELRGVHIYAAPRSERWIKKFKPWLE